MNPENYALPPIEINARSSDEAERAWREFLERFNLHPPAPYSRTMLWMLRAFVCGFKAGQVTRAQQLQ